MYLHADFDDGNEVLNVMSAVYTLILYYELIEKVNIYVNKDAHNILIGWFIATFNASKDK